MVKEPKHDFNARHFRAFAIALTARDPYTGFHCDRTLNLCAELGLSCGLTMSELSLLQSAAVMHDIGKVAIPDHILLKPGRLDADEMAMMQAHAARGANLLEALQMEELEDVVLAVRHHHEGFDGSGYPHSIAGEAIPIISRIIALADSYDAIATARPYHSARSHAEVMRIIDAETGVKFDPYLVAKFMSVIESSGYRAP